MWSLFFVQISFQCIVVLFLMDMVWSGGILWTNKIKISPLLRCWKAIKSCVCLCVQSGGFLVAMSPTMFIPGLTLRVGVCPLLLTCRNIGVPPLKKLTASDAATCSYFKKEMRRRWGFIRVLEKQISISSVYTFCTNDRFLKGIIFPGNVAYL